MHAVDLGWRLLGLQLRHAVDPTLVLLLHPNVGLVVVLGGVVREDVVLLSEHDGCAGLGGSHRDGQHRSRDGAAHHLE
jgi:hypothetical protein